MHQAQFVLDPNQTRDVVWAQVSKVRNVLWNRFVFGSESESVDGRRRTVFVDSKPAADVATPSVIEVAEDPTLDIRTLFIQTGDADSFAEMLGAVSQNVDAVPLAELAGRVESAPDDIEALTHLGLGLVGVRFDRQSYSAIAAALTSSRASVRARAAHVAKQIKWRALLRPLWHALGQQTPGTEAYVGIASAFTALDLDDPETRYVLADGMEIEDVIVLSKISFDLRSEWLVESRADSGWTVNTADGELAWRALECEGVVVMEVAPEWRERTLGLAAMLRAVPREELLEAASEMRERSLLRLASSGRRFDPLIDGHLVEGLHAPAVDSRLDAVIAIASSEWDPAIPDILDLVDRESDPEVRQLARAMLMLA